MSNSCVFTIWFDDSRFCYQTRVYSKAGCLQTALKDAVEKITGVRYSVNIISHPNEDEDGVLLLRYLDVTGKQRKFCNLYFRYMQKEIKMSALQLLRK